MGKILNTKKPSGTSEFDFFLQDIWEAIENRTRIIPRAGVLDVAYTDKGVEIIPVQSTGRSVESNPFLIYRSTDWLTYRVGEGIIIGTGDPITIINAEDEDFPISGGVLRYWFYIEMDATTAEIKTSATTLEWSTTLIPLGWVDTQTGSGTNTAKIYQLVRDHIFNPCAT
jgi:hypothetical protein